MELHNLSPAAGSVKSRKRIARGVGTGKGGTSTRGHKGAKARAGNKLKRAFEGGQMPLQMRLPKRGFKNPNRKVYVPINLERLQFVADKYALTVIDQAVLVEKGVVSKNDLIKVLGVGELTAALTITAHKCSETAKEKIEGAGGTINLV